MNILPESIAVYGQNCAGCKDTERDLMLTFASRVGAKDGVPGHVSFIDVFLTGAQAEEIIDKITQAVEHYRSTEES